MAYEGTATLSVGDGLGGTLAESATDIELGNMGKSSPVDPTAEVALGGLLTAIDATTEDPAYDYDKRIAAAEAAYRRATTPKTVSRPVSASFSVSGAVTAAG
ncbi:MAG: hypothetical protein J7518_22125 [Nocardioidaceae bacterium]|nr:hypothetical protein [Nocardioidaceae bacterium]